jgi:hypothetical protein
MTERLFVCKANSFRIFVSIFKFKNFVCLCGELIKLVVAKLMFAGGRMPAAMSPGNIATGVFPDGFVHGYSFLVEANWPRKNVPKQKGPLSPDGPF